MGEEDPATALPDEADVVVVGAGPTGVVLAAVLARAGIDVVVVDAAAGPERESSRATSVHALTLAQLDGLDGAGRELAEHGAIAESSSLWHGRSLLGEARWRDLPGPHPYMLNLPQERTEEVMRRRLLAAGGGVHWGVTAEAVEVDADRSMVRLRAPGGRVRTISTRYAVGSDGAHSAVRKSIGVELRGTTHPERFLLADVALDTDLDLDQTHVFVSTRGVLGVMPMPWGAFRLNGTLTDDEPLTRDALESAVGARLAAAADRVRLVDAVWAGDYRTHSRLAERYRVGPVFLAGDAAHLVSPVGGQGMNLGIQDAINLGWKLVHVLRGWAPPSLLGTYEAERRPAAAAALRMSEMSTRMFAARRRPERALRNTFMRIGHRIPPVQRSLTWGPAGFLQTYRSEAIAGAPDGAGDSLGRHVARRLPAGVDWSLLPVPEARHVLVVGPDSSPLLEAAADRAGIQSRMWPDLVSDATGMLIRPDGFVAWTGSDGEGLANVLRAMSDVQRG